MLAEFGVVVLPQSCEGLRTPASQRAVLEDARQRHSQVWLDLVHCNVRRSTVAPKSKPIFEWCDQRIAAHIKKDDEQVQARPPSSKALAPSRLLPLS
jgi:hypothetical protein